ncbi:MAG: DMT family transporter [Anaerolineales bacterium]
MTRAPISTETRESDSAAPTSAGGIALVLLATACWSTSGIFIRFISDGSAYSPVGLAFWRDLTTFLVLLIGLALIDRSLLRVKRRDLPWLAAMGAFSIGVFHVLWNTSVLLNGVSVSTVIQCSAPVFVTVMARFLWQEPVTRSKLMAIALASTGIVLIARLSAGSGVRITLYGLAVALLSALFYGSFSLFGKKLTGTYRSWTILVYVFGFAALVLLPFRAGEPGPWTLEPRVLASFSGLVLLTTVAGFGLYTAGLHRLQASVASITSNSEVVFAAALSYVLLGERLDPRQILGALLVVGGVSLLSASRFSSRRSAKRAASSAADGP